MKPIVVVIFLLLTFSCSQKQEQTQQYFTNPILSGFYPDPSICKVGDDFYMVTSTFAYYPGLPILHSKDLVNWETIGFAMDRPEQLNLDGHGVSRGLFAPSIRYHNGLYYITCTLIDTGGNFVITATDPAGPWSDPYWLPEVNGIDPSMYFDEDKAYILYNSIPPDDKSLYSGHRTIRMFAFDVDSMRVTGDEILLVNGGVDISKNPVWIEAPHIFKKDGYYYLICAEGGTAYNHSEVVFRSESATGPYVPWDKNPILTQRHLDPSRPNPITTTGHADFVELENGEWWAVFLGCRPYADKDYFNTGRETFLAPVKWIDRWPVINPDFEEVQYRYPVPVSGTTQSASNYSRFNHRYEFDEDKLHYNFQFLRTVREKWYSLSDHSGHLTLAVRPETCSGKMNPSFVAHRQPHLTGSASTSMAFSPATENEMAGLMIFQNETHFYFLAKTLVEGKPAIALYQSSVDGEEMKLLVSEEIDGEVVRLKIEARRDTYAFFFSVLDGDWTLLKENIDARFLSTREAGGFVGCMYAMYATSLGRKSTSMVNFDWFEVLSEDQ
ncbi:MAG: glycoside hydrolase family 43 protein [Cyclobacteriaceae bacterium]|nr:MAG: glycoside hydrolase family 43 protein [Cyclobacteriaceae bacterium]